MDSARDAWPTDSDKQALCVSRAPAGRARLTQWFCFPMGTCLFPMGTSIDWVPIGNREHGNMAELGNTLGTWEQFFRVGNMGTTRGLGTIGNISKSGILKLGTIGNSSEQFGTVRKIF